MIERARFVEEWSERLGRGSASMFVGAGTSMRAGYPSWRSLLGKVAEELDLDIEQEHDLAAVAQHYVNRNRGRGRLTQLLAGEFPRRPVPSLLRIVGRLPLRNVWTTNWDELIETAFRDARREPDVKERTGDLTYDRPGADATVYKMHGSARHLDEVVLATDDFELYRIKREAFLRVLAGHLISTSFLFVGISFTDPNLGHLLAGIREMYQRYAPEGHGQTHYAMVRKPQEVDFRSLENGTAKLKTARVRHELFVEDLKRYNIHCVEVGTYDEIDEILAEVELRLASRAVFVSGSLANGALNEDDSAYVRAVAQEVGRRIGRSGKKLVSGYGLGIGDHVLSGMLSEPWLASTANLDSRVMIRPFPQSLPSGIDPDAFKLRYREDLVAVAGTCVVICGIRSEGGGNFASAPGVRQEVDIARRLGRRIVPIGATMGAAKEIWDDLAAAAPDPRLPTAEFAVLGDRKQAPEQIGAALETVLRIG